jgi:serine/threonine-protein kinase RsbW
MMDNVSISLPSNYKYISIARLSASVVANSIGFDIEQIEDIKVAVGEACNNAILHSESDDLFDLNFIVEKDKLSIEVTDNGKGFNLMEYEAPDLENPGGNGLGIFIMKSLMDDVTIDAIVGKGTKITMIKNVK